jgi:hypothetical protein
MTATATVTAAEAAAICPPWCAGHPEPPCDDLMHRGIRDLIAPAITDQIGPADCQQIEVGLERLRVPDSSYGRLGQRTVVSLFAPGNSGCIGVTDLTPDEAVQLAATLQDLAGTARREGDSLSKEGGRTMSAATVAEARQARGPVRPFWLTEPCPAWCSADHGDTDSPEDRDHIGHVGRVDLLLERADFTIVNGVPAGISPGVLAVSVIQHYRETEPYVELVRNGDADSTDMTLAEVSDLISTLQDAVHAGRHAASAQPADCSRRVEDG